jgi:hypothetical protein
MKIKILGDKKKMSKELKVTALLKAEAIKQHFKVSDEEIRLDLSDYHDEFELCLATGVWIPIEVIHLSELNDIDTLVDYSSMGDRYLWRWL